jgi:hypothetical protein
VTIKLFICSQLEDVLAAVGAMVLRNQGRPFLTFLLAQIRGRLGYMRLGFVKPAIRYMSWCSFLAKTQGLKGLVLTLKALNTSLAQTIARDLGSFPSTPRVKRGMLGLPTVIPVLHRQRIAVGDLLIIRYWFTLFSIYRVIEFPGKISFSSITDAGKDLSGFLPDWSRFAYRFWTKLSVMGAVDEDDLKSPLTLLASLRVSPFLIPRTTPTNDLYLSTSPFGIIRTAIAWSQSELLPFFKDWLQLTRNTRFLNWFEEFSKIAPSLLTEEARVTPTSIGKLGLKDEPAGKIRVFAMVDCFTQWAMKPLHDYLFAILRVIPQDGTFDQLAPISLLQAKGHRRFWSLDLSSATDRLPILIQGALLSRLITAHGANLWMSLMVGRAYSLPRRAMGPDYDGERFIRYAVGQPMGALTSWAMLALTHHAIVQMAAELSGRVSGDSWFEDYALLGDDIVIADRLVADTYLKIMAGLGVGIQLSKSVHDSSGRGVLEFAKRIFYGGNSVGPLALLEVLSAAGSLPAWLELVGKYSLSLTQGLMLLGFGYKSVSRINQPWSALPRRLQGYVVSYYGPGGPGFEGDILKWMASGGPEYLYPDLIWVKDLAASIRQRVIDLLPRAKALTKLVEVDRTRAHYGTSKYEPWQLPKFLFIGDPKYSGSLWPRAVRSNPDAIWLSLEPENLSQDQIRSLMGMIEFCYRDSFFDLHSELRGLEQELTSLLEADLSLDRLSVLVSRVETLEKDIEGLGLAPDLTIRRQAPRPTDFVRGGEWLARWRSWRKVRRNLNSY